MFDVLYLCEEILVPLFPAMPVELGGLDFNPVTIGYILGSYRAFTAFFLMICCPRIVHHLGERQAFCVAIYSAMFAWVIMPIANILARHSGITMSVWVCVAFLALPGALLAMGIGSSFPFLSRITLVIVNQPLFLKLAVVSTSPLWHLVMTLLVLLMVSLG